VEDMRAVGPNVRAMIAKGSGRMAVWPFTRGRGSA
jgi:hypothetical protein